MNSQFIRTFADDLNELRKNYARGSNIEETINDAVYRLHYIARLLEQQERLNVRKNG